MTTQSPEERKRPGVCYAVTIDGVELPVVDITHPAFALDVPDRIAVDAMITKAVREQDRTNRLPAFVRKPLLWMLSRNSVLMRGIIGANETFLSGMTTYLMKLGADNLGAHFSGKLDKAVASSLPAFSLRLRLRDASQVMAGQLVPLLSARPKAPLHFINIAGGAASDSLNSLILLHKEFPHLLSGRAVMLHVYDLECGAPAFAERALQALNVPTAPLAGIDVAFEYRPYNWLEPARLETYLADLDLEDAVVAVSSEGGLGDYGGEQAVSSNLQAVAAGTPANTTLMMTITPNEGPAAVFNAVSVARIVPRSLQEFTRLAEHAGWRFVESREQPMNTVVGLRKM